MLNSGDVLKVDQTHVETVIPAIGEIQYYIPDSCLVVSLFLWFCFV